MRGLIYKDCSIFYKSVDKRVYLVAIGAILLLLYQGKTYGGLLASVMLAMTIGIQHIMSFSLDEKANWRSYQLTMPISCFSVVASKYLSVLCTLGVSLAGSLILTLLSGLCSGQLVFSLFWLSGAASILLPLLLTGICLPFTYWFGFRSAQSMGMLFVFPMFYFTKYLEDGPGFSVLTNASPSLIVIGCILIAFLFMCSLGISIIGYQRKQ